MSGVIAARLSDGNKYLTAGIFSIAFIPAWIISQQLWKITPFSWT